MPKDTIAANDGGESGPDGAMIHRIPSDRTLRFEMTASDQGTALIHDPISDHGAETLLPSGSAVAADEVDQADPPSQIRMAPQFERVCEPLPQGTGFVPPPMDLSHLTGDRMPELAASQVLPERFDWRDRDGFNYVTPVRSQGDCGACYAFAAIGGFESRLLIDGASKYDLSENQAKECNWRRLNGVGGGCDGGHSFMMASLFSQTGTVLESCDPYVDSNDVCRLDLECPYQQTLLGWGVISGDSVPDPAVLKAYLHNYGPVLTSMYVDKSKGFDYSYNGSYTFDYATPGTSTNHAVLIVGWSDTLPPVPGGTTPVEGWIVKNSWGSGWGDEGYFYMTYQAANIGIHSSFIYDWQDYDPHGDLWYYDDSFARQHWGCSDPTAWGLASFTAPDDTNVTRVEVWTTDVTTDIDVYIYGRFDGTAPSNLLTSGLNHSFDEAGYHSIPLSSPLRVNSGDEVVVVLRITNESHSMPLALDPDGAIETGRTYASCHGTPSSWFDMGTTYKTDVAIRVRTSRSVGAPPTVTSIIPNNRQNTGSVSVSIGGTDFKTGASVKLTRAGDEIPGTGVTVVSPSQIRCNFNLTGKAVGSWNVVVTNSDAQSGTLTNGFTISSPSLPGDPSTVFLPVVLRRYPPVPAAPNLHAITPNPSTDGSYTVSWSAGSGPAATSYQIQEDGVVIQSGLGGQSRSFSGKSSGTYTYRVRGWNAHGYGPWSQSRSVTVQSGGTARLYSVADACIIEGRPTTNYGHTTDMWAGYDDHLTPDGKIVRSLVKFNLASLPAGQQITKATLRLYLVRSWDYPNTSRTIGTYRVTSAWSEGGVNWNNRPGCGEAYGSRSIGSQAWGWYEFDVTNVIRAWHTGTHTNHGIMVRGPEHSGANSSWRAFSTREGDYRPQLVVTYGG